MKHLDLVTETSNVFHTIESRQLLGIYTSLSRRKTWTCLSSSSNRSESIHKAPRFGDKNIKCSSYDRIRTTICKPHLGCLHQLWKERITTATIQCLRENFLTQNVTFTQTHGHDPDRKTTINGSCYPYQTVKKFLIRERRGGYLSWQHSGRRCYEWNSNQQDIQAFPHSKRWRQERNLNHGKLFYDTPQTYRKSEITVRHWVLH